MVEGAVGKAAGPKNAILNSVTSLLDDFFVGTTHDGNMDAMLAHYAAVGSYSHHGLQCYFESSGLSHTESDVAGYFRKAHIGAESLNEPSHWRFTSLD